MQLKQRSESIVKCSCGRDAYRRTLAVVSPGIGGREVSFDTHEQDILSDEHVSAARRMRDFHELLYQLLAELKGQDLKLSSGRMSNLNADTVHPEACEKRTRFVPTASIQAFGQPRGVTGEPMELEGATVETFMANVREAAEQEVAKLRRLREEGEI